MLSKQYCIHTRSDTCFYVLTMMTHIRLRCLLIGDNCRGNTRVGKEGLCSSLQFHQSALKTLRGGRGWWCWPGHGRAEVWCPDVAYLWKRHDGYTCLHTDVCVGYTIICSEGPIMRDHCSYVGAWRAVCVCVCVCVCLCVFVCVCVYTYACVYV